MEALVDQGLARPIGVSNFSGAPWKAPSAGARIRPEALQIERQPLLRQISKEVRQMAPGMSD